MAEGPQMAVGRAYLRRATLACCSSDQHEQQVRKP